MGTIGAQFLPEDFPVFIESVEAAEAAGYDHAWFVDSQMLWQDCLRLHDARARRDGAHPVGTAVANPLTRHVTVNASAAATLAGLHPGRVELGIGTGRQRGPHDRPEAGGDDGSSPPIGSEAPDADGRRRGRPRRNPGHVRWAAGRQPAPILMAATGRGTSGSPARSPTASCSYVGVDPDAVRWAIGHVHAGAAEAGRDPTDVEISLLAAMWVSDDLEEARAEMPLGGRRVANHLARRDEAQPRRTACPTS